jgi:hypothetical protein
MFFISASSTLVGGKGGAGPSSLRITLCLRDWRSMWMRDGCNSLYGFLRGIEWIMLHGFLDCFQKPPLGGTPDTKQGDHYTPNIHKHWFILFFFYHVWGPARVEIHRNSIWLRARSHMASHNTWGTVTTWHDSGGDLGRALDHFLFGLSQLHGHGSWL